MQSKDLRTDLRTVPILTAKILRLAWAIVGLPPAAGYLHSLTLCSLRMTGAFDFWKTVRRFYFCITVLQCNTIVLKPATLPHRGRLKLPGGNYHSLFANDWTVRECKSLRVR